VALMGLGVLGCGYALARSIDLELTHHTRARGSLSCARQ
jgi:hypothetical protein